jgi:hypothetical protein
MLKQTVYRLIEACGTTLVSFLIIERFNLGGIQNLQSWVEKYPGIALLNCFVLLAAFLLIRVFFKKPLIPVIIFSSLVYFIGGVHHLKLLLKGEPLLPMDIYNIKVAAMIAPSMNIQINRGFFLNLALLLFWVGVIWLYQKKVWQPLILKRRYGIGVMLVLSLLFFGYLFDGSHRAQLGVIDIRYNQIINYQRNGFTMATLTNLTGTKIKAPAGYNQHYFSELRNHLTPMESTNKVLPHIIVLQMEAYGDPRLIDPQLRYQPDPFAALDKYRPGMHSFNTITSVLGGSTATTEFEVLTGFNMSFAPQGTMPFVQYMNRARPAIAWDLQKLGYQTVGIHPNIGSFYARDIAYPNLGFQSFKTIEDFPDPDFVGYYVSDKSTAQKIIETFEARTAKEPLFCFAVTIENHGPYNLTGLDRQYGVQAGQVPLDEMQIKELKNFGANLQDSSLMLAELLAYFEQKQEPVIVLAYGDHQATWSWAQSLPDSFDVLKAKYFTEGFFWTNYEADYDDRDLINANFLTAYLLKYAGLIDRDTVSPYYQALLEQAEQAKGYNPYFIINRQGEFLPQPEELVKTDALVQYDRVFGKNYLESVK